MTQRAKEEFFEIENNFMEELDDMKEQLATMKLSMEHGAT